MLINSNILEIQKRNIILDLACRKSSPDKFSVTPYTGLADVVDQQLGRRAAFDLTDLLLSQKDFDAHIKKPTEGKRNPNELRSKYVHNYLVRLEDIDKSWVESYFTDVLIGLKLNQSNSLREIEKDMKTHNTWLDEDSEFTSELDLLLETQTFELDKALIAKEKFVYILARLHRKSKEIRLSLFSLIVAYEKCKKLITHMEPSSGKVLECGVYRMCVDGTFGEYFRRNEGTYREFFDWVAGAFPNDPLYKNAMELRYLCTELGIDLANEDPLQYDEFFISQILVTHVISNRNYYQSEHLSMNSDNYKILGDIKMDDFDKQIVAATTEVNFSQVIERVKFRFSGINIPNKEVDRSKIAEEFIYIYAVYYDFPLIEALDKNLLVTEDGFYKYYGRSSYLFDVSDITKKPHLSAAKALLHSSGYLVLILSENTFYFLTAELAIEYLKDLKTNKSVNDYKYSANRNFGTWMTIDTYK